MVNCPRCGLELKETSLGNYFCPNCGKYEREEIEIEYTNGERSYIG